MEFIFAKKIKQKNILLSKIFLKNIEVIYLKLINQISKIMSSTFVTQISDIDGEAGGDNSGWSVSLSADGSVVAIGAIYNDGNGTHSGHVRIYKSVNNSWTQVGGDIDGAAADNYSGSSVSLSSDGSVVAIGSPHNDGNGLDKSCKDL